MTDNPFDAFERLSELLAETVQSIGLQQITFQPVIDKRTGQRIITAMFALEAPLTPEPVEESSGDPELDAILSGIAEATVKDGEERAEKERQELHDLYEAQQAELMAERVERAKAMKERLRDPGNGFLDD